MPTDANGNYSLPDTYRATTGQTIQVSQHNPPLEDLAQAMSGRLPRNGAAPMTGPLKLVAGTEQAPALAWTTGPGTGIYQTADGLGVSVNGSRVAEFTAAGLKRGARYIGELIPGMFAGALPLTVQPYGQTLSRAAYPDLWALAQAMIAVGHPFYNNGDGVSTFGIGDLRGRTLAAIDNLGGARANRLTSSYFGQDTSGIGAAGGGQSGALSVGHMPAHNHGGQTGSMNRSNPHAHSVNTDSLASRSTSPIGYDFPVATTSAVGAETTSANIDHEHAIPMQGGGAAFSLVQPTMLTNFLLFAGA